MELGRSLQLALDELETELIMYSLIGFCGRCLVIRSAGFDVPLIFMKATFWRSCTSCNQRVPTSKCRILPAPRLSRISQCRGCIYMQSRIERQPEVCRKRHATKGLCRGSYNRQQFGLSTALGDRILGFGPRSNDMSP